MPLIQTRPEKAEQMTVLVGTIRNEIAKQASSGELNLAECVNATAQVFSSVLVGAYDKKNREIVLSMLPDLVRAYFPQWEKIYAAHGHKAERR